MKQVKIYGPALASALAAAGVTNLSRESRELGCAENYLRNAIYRNSIALPIAMRLEQKYGVDCKKLKMPVPADLLKASEQTALGLAKPAVTQEDIYKAVYYAIIDAFRNIEWEEKQ